MSEIDHDYLHHRKRLRDRFRKSGFVGFADYEVIELLLTFTIPRKDVKQIAKRLILRFKDLRGILDASTAELSTVPGIGSVTALAFHAFRSIASLYLQQSTEGFDLTKDYDNLENLWRLRIGSSRNEIFEIAYLDSSYHLLRDGIETLQEGTIDRASVYPRRVIEAALFRGAAAVVIAHNHPDGNVTPSEYDKVLTHAVVLAAETVNLRVLDHLIIAPDKAFSFRTAGLL